MKRFLYGVVVLLVLVAFTGCKEAAEILAALPSDDIINTWETTIDVSVAEGEAVLLAGSFIDISATNFDMYVNIEDVGWVSVYGTISPNPSTSISSMLTVTNSSQTEFLAVGDTLTFSYVLSSPSVVVLYIDGDAFPAVPGTMPS